MKVLIKYYDKNDKEISSITLQEATSDNMWVATVMRLYETLPKNLQSNFRSLIKCNF